MSKILVTGAAGFIGFHTVELLLKDNHEVVGLDNLNDYYDVNLKWSRLKEHGIHQENVLENELSKSTTYDNYSFLKTDIANHDFMVEMMIEEKFDYVINLAAQAGVRYSLENPRAYTHSNINGFLSILEGCRQSKVKHLVYASTSSVYGLNEAMPLNESMPTEHQISLYAATKKANEMMAHSYAHLYQIPTTGLRFFTVYGPWGRPDMALFLFTDAILNNKPIQIFNHGKMVRDFTYVSDIAESIKRVTLLPAKQNPDWSGMHPEINTSSAPYQIFNIGNSNPLELGIYIDAIEKAIGKTAIKNFRELQAGDVLTTHADTSRLEKYVGFKPRTDVYEGVQDFVIWYKNYYNKVN
jgi:UDP-glucuronate 4-epimerase